MSRRMVGGGSAMEEFEASVRVELCTGRKFPLLLAVFPSATCNDILETVRDTTLELELTNSGSQWKLIERWNGLEKKLSGRTNFSSALNSWYNEKVTFIAREKRTASHDHVNRQKQQDKKLSLKQTTNKICLKKRELHDVKREVTKLRLAIIKRSSLNNPSSSSSSRSSGDPIRLGIQMIATMSDKLDTLKNSKAQLANEVFDMNHEATRLTAHLTVLRRTSQSVSDSLTQFQETRDRKKAEREKEKTERLEYLNEAIASSQVELDKRLRMSELQDGKIILLQEEISTLQKSLNQREKEVEKMKEWGSGGDHHTGSEMKVNSSTSSLSLPIDLSKREREGGDSFKRRFMNTTIKTKQQIEEEARVFRKVSSGSSLAKQESTDGPNGETGGAHLESQTVQRKSREEKKEKKGILRSSIVGSDQLLLKLKKKVTQSVNFDAKSLLLNAAGEGELDLIKKCVKELGSDDCKMIVSAKGATCLHNAVCSGNLNAIQYFIDLGCDINAQDCEGWTPLHCAAGFTHLPAIHLLVQNGASLYLRTSDNQLSVDLVREMVEEGIDDAAGNDIDAQNCYDYLRDCSNGLGTLNQRLVYGLFNYIATSNEELSFIIGEQLVVIQRGTSNEGWWEVENAHGTRGYVPSTFLGSYPRKQTVL